MKKVSIVLIICLLLCSACGKNKNLDKDSKGNCSVFDCIKQINTSNTVDEINEIIGFEGEKTSDEYNSYYWELSSQTGVEVTYYGGSNGTIKIDYDNELLKTKKVDFSRYDELQTKIKSGITYDEFIKYLGNVEGTIIEKNTVSTKYTWVSEDERYLNASFSNSSHNCIFASGRV